MTKLAIIGSRDLGQLVAHHASSTKQFEVVGFFDDYRSKGETTPHGPILGKIQELAAAHASGRIDAFLMGVGYDHLTFRNECYIQLRNEVPAATFIHPSCYVDTSAKIEEGCFLLPGCVIDAGVVIHKNSLLNTACTIAHDTTVGTNCFLGPGVNLTGFITIGSDCFIGAGTTMVEKLSICSGVQTGAGAVITKPISTPGLYVGVPAVRKR